MKGFARFSDCGVYRYTLGRIWDEKLPGNVCWVMLNPSTADADRSDPTVRRCVQFSHHWGYGSLTVVNLYAYRATDPRKLDDCEDPVGEFNDDHIAIAAARADLVVAAWGAHVPKRAPLPTARHHHRVETVLRLLGTDVHCLGHTVNGSSRHPLYVPVGDRPVLFGGVPEAARSRTAS